MVKERRLAKEIRAVGGAREMREKEEEFMGRMGVYVDHTLADGNCFFRAMSMALYGCEDRHPEIRQHVCDYMVANCATLRDFCTPNEEVERRQRSRRSCVKSSSQGASSSSSSGPAKPKGPVRAAPTDDHRDAMFLRHVERMREDREWADMLELGAFCSAYRRQLGVFVLPASLQDEPRLQMVGEESFLDDVLYVAFRQGGQHYETVRNLGGPHHGLPCCKPLVEREARSGGQSAAQQDKSATETDGKSDQRAVAATPREKKGVKRRLSDRGEEDGEDGRSGEAKKSKSSADVAPAAVAEAEAPSAEGKKAARKPKASPTPETRSTTPDATDKAGSSNPARTTAAGQQAGPPLSSAGRKRSLSQRGADGEEQEGQHARPRKAPKPAPRTRYVPNDGKGAALLKQQRLNRRDRTSDAKAPAARRPEDSASGQSERPAAPAPAVAAAAPSDRTDTPRVKPKAEPKEVIRKTETGRVEKKAGSIPSAAGKYSPATVLIASPTFTPEDYDGLPPHVKKMSRLAQTLHLKRDWNQMIRARNSVRRQEPAEGERKGGLGKKVVGKDKASAIFGSTPRPRRRK